MGNGNIQLKPYPAGVVLHALIDACLEQRERLRQAQRILPAGTRSPSSAPTVPSRATRSSAAQRSACGCSEPAHGLQGSRSSATPPRSTPKLRDAPARRRRARSQPRQDGGTHPHRDHHARRAGRRGPWTMRGSKPSCAARGARAPDLLEGAHAGGASTGLPPLKRIVFRRAALGAGGTAVFLRPSVVFVTCE